MKTQMVALALVLFGTASGALAKDYYVDGANGKDSWAGTSSDRPFKTLQRAADFVRNLQEDAAVHVAPGTYVKATVLRPDPNRIKNPVCCAFTVIGEGTAEDPVVIDGGETNACFIMNNSCKIGSFRNIVFRNGRSSDGGGILCTAPYTPVRVGEVTDCVFENCVATNGCGGAVMTFRGEAAFSNCVFRNCHALNGTEAASVFTHEKGAGGAVMNFDVTNGQDTVFLDCKFENCSAENRGGAVVIRAHDETEDVGLVIERSLFSQCHSEVLGGAIAGIVRRCVDTDFVGNSSAADGGVWGQNEYLSQPSGGDFWLTNTFVRCVFRENSATNGGCFAYQYAKRFAFEDCVFSNNVAHADNSVMHASSAGKIRYLSFDKCAFADNRGNGLMKLFADRQGGDVPAVFIRASKFVGNDGCGSNATGSLVSVSAVSRIERCRFLSNIGGRTLDFVATANCPTNRVRNCLFVGNTNVVGRGVAGGLWLWMAALDFCNNTLVGNMSAVAPTAVSSDNPGHTEDYGCQYANNVIFGNRTLDGSAVEQVFSLYNVRGKYSCLEAGGTTIADGVRGNIVTSARPFVAREGVDYYVRRRFGRDAGLEFDWMAGATDLGGNARVLGGGPDMGCYELKGEGAVLSIK